MITEGSVPMALPGGAAMASAPPMPARKPLLARTPASAAVAFPGAAQHAVDGKGMAFHHRGKAFPRGA